MPVTQNGPYAEIIGVIDELKHTDISENRKAFLRPLIDYVQSRVDEGKAIRINFICTHNSRRSHLSQIWAQTMASYFNINGVACYSGGTEATALFPMVVETLKKQGWFQHSKAFRGCQSHICHQVFGK